MRARPYPHRTMKQTLLLLAMHAVSPRSPSSGAAWNTRRPRRCRPPRFRRPLSTHPSAAAAAAARAPRANVGVLVKTRGGASSCGGSDGVDSLPSGALTSFQTKTSPTYKSRNRAMARTGAVAIATVAIAMLVINSEVPALSRERFRSVIIQRLNAIASKGDAGILLYASGLVWWEVCGLPTAVVETAAGMAFGFEKGLLGSFVGKTCGSLVAFTLGRMFLTGVVRRKLEGKESIGLIERGVAKSPITSALVVRYSPFPQLIKNFALSVTMPVTFRVFFLAITIHGFPFSLLWAALGEDSAARLRASDAGEIMEANAILKGLLVFVTVFGFVISPAATGWWLAGLRRKGEENL